MLNEKCDDDEIDDLDWEFLKLLIRSGMVSVKNYPRVLTHAAVAQRLDILSEILRFVSDLTEDQCLFLLTSACFIPEAVLVRLFV